MHLVLIKGRKKNDRTLHASSEPITETRHVIVLLRFSICCPLWGASLFVLRLYIVLEGIVVVFGTIRSVIISCADITTFAVAELRAAPLTSALGLLLGGVILRCLIAIAFFGCVHHVYII